MLQVILSVARKLNGKLALVLRLVDSDDTHATCSVQVRGYLHASIVDLIADGTATRNLVTKNTINVARSFANDRHSALVVMFAGAMFVRPDHATVLEQQFYEILARRRLPTTEILEWPATSDEKNHEHVAHAGQTCLIQHAGNKFRLDFLLGLHDLKPVSAMVVVHENVECAFQ